MANKETIENVKIIQKSYDETPYKSKTFYYTQPGRQQMVLKLLGFKTPDLEKARVLEIGCSFGGNIIPFALENPKADFYYLVTLKNIKWKGLSISGTTQNFEDHAKNFVGSPYSPKVIEIER